MKILEKLNDIFAKVAFAESGLHIHDYDETPLFSIRCNDRLEQVTTRTCKVCSKKAFKTRRLRCD